MTYVVARAPFGLAVDSDEVFTDAALEAIWARGARVIITYAEILTAALLARYTGGAHPFGVSVITYSRANGWTPSADTGAADAKRALDVVHSLGVPPGLVLWDDIEGPAQGIQPSALIDHVDSHGAIVAAAADIAGVYIGWGAGLTSEEWQSRPNTHRYWKAGGITRDRAMKAVEPSRGWTCIQGLPFNQKPGGGAVVDLDFLVQDQRGDGVTCIYAEGRAPGQLASEQPTMPEIPGTPPSSAPQAPEGE